MGDLLSDLLSPSAHTPPPIDDYWYGGSGVLASSGQEVTSEMAMLNSAVFACVRVLAETVGIVPLITYRRLPGGGKDRAFNHPLYRLFHEAPNKWQTPLEFKEMLTGHVALRGNGFARIVSGDSGPFSELIPLHPDRIIVERLPDGVLRYRHLTPEGEEKRYLQDEMFHLRGMTSDGIRGISILKQARNAIGLSAAAEDYGAKSFKQGVRLSGVLQHPGVLRKETATRIANQFTAAYGGSYNAGKVAVLEEGMEWQALGMTSEDAQFLESRHFQVAEIARFFRVPLVLIQETEKSTSWGTGIEQFMLGFVTQTMMSWFTRWEQRISRDMILQPHTFFAEFLVDALLRGDSKTRAEVLAIWRANGVINADDWRELENMNPLPGGKGKDYLYPSNMSVVGKEPEPLPAPSPPDDDDTPPEEESGSLPPGRKQPGALDDDRPLLASRRMIQIAGGVAASVAHKEEAALTRAARKYADDGVGWETFVRSFYDNLATEITDRGLVNPNAAARYAEQERDAVLFYGAGALESRQESKVLTLTSLIVEGDY